MFNNHFRVILFTGSLLALLLSFLAYSFLPVSDAKEGIIFEISAGDGFKEIVENLYNQGLIRFPTAFKIYSVLNGAAHQLKPGKYKISSSMNNSEIIRILVAGPEKDVAVFIKEGDTLRAVDKKLTVAGILPAGSLVKYKGRYLEGLLFPDTYRFFPNSPLDAVIEKFISNFYQKNKTIIGNSNEDFYKVLIIASMIEKEVPFNEDRQVVSGIIRKRLAIGMPLQIDATQLYAKEVRNSRYDTYEYYGLPPTPISNPGFDAIWAAANPQKSEFLYYLSDPTTKKTIFSKTLEEHSENRWKYLRR
ncbi:MAG: endolytic transglycosylase MltG [Patescibacteria group bacterium]